LYAFNKYLGLLKFELKPKAFNIFFILILGTVIDIYAQISAGGDFMVVSNEGCNPFTVSVINLYELPAVCDTNPDSSVCKPVTVYQYSEGLSQSNDTFYVYTNPGIHKITQLVAGRTPRLDSLFIRVVEPIPPSFILSNCKGSEAFIYAEDTLYNAYFVDWGDGTSEKVPKGQINQHDYGSLGTFSVTVTGLMDSSMSETDLANINCLSTPQDITLIDDIIPGKIDQVEVMNGDSVLLNYSIDTGTSYYLEVSLNGSSNFTIVDTLAYGTFPNNYIVDGLDTETNYYCFRLTAFDPCDGDTRPSLVGCSILLNGAAANNENRVNWQTETTDLLMFEVFKDNSVINSQTGFQYIDTDVQCGWNYCYRIVMSENNGFESYSDTICITAISTDTPPGISDINATVENDMVELSWSDPATIPLVYFINRYVKGGTQAESFNSTTSAFTDSTSRPSQNSYLYEISYEDLCGNVSPVATASPVFLSKYLSTTIQWTNYQGWQNGFQFYQLETYDDGGQLLNTINIGTDTSYAEVDFTNLPQNVVYRIVVVPNDMGLPDVHSNFLPVTFPSSVVFPNAFTPNGDGLNDVFIYEGLFINEFRMVIYNRWGEAIYVTENPDLGWDGTTNSKQAPSDMYIFNAEFKDESGISFVKKGEVYLLR